MSNTQIDILVIKPNTFEFNKQLYYKNIDTLSNDISQFIEIKTIDFSEMMDNIITIINLTPELIGHSPIVHETNTHVFQLCYVGSDSPDDKELACVKVDDNKPTNNIASYLNGEKTYGTVVALSSVINDDYTCTPDNITVNNIANILYSKFIHKGIYIGVNENENIIEFDYSSHPIEFYKIEKEEDFDNFKIIDAVFMGFSLCMVIQKNPINNTINKRATRIFGTHRINGDVLLISKSTHEYYDLSTTIFNKIHCLSYGPLKLRELDENEKQAESVHEQKYKSTQTALNKYVILDKKYADYKNKYNKCYNCNDTFSDKILVCNGCYRLRYDSLECQKEDWVNHKKECLNNTECINK